MLKFTHICVPLRGCLCVFFIVNRPCRGAYLVVWWRNSDSSPAHERFTQKPHARSPTERRVVVYVWVIGRVVAPLATERFVI